MCFVVRYVLKYSCVSLSKLEIGPVDAVLALIVVYILYVPCPGTITPVTTPQKESRLIH